MTVLDNNIFSAVLAIPGAPDEVIDAASCLLRLARMVDDTTEYRQSSIEGFNPHLMAMRNALVLTATLSSQETARAFLETVHQARQYAFEHFTNDHGVLLTTYYAMVAIANMANLNLAEEEQRMAA